MPAQTHHLHLLVAPHATLAHQPGPEAKATRNHACQATWSEALLWSSHHHHRCRRHLHLLYQYLITPWLTCSAHRLLRRKCHLKSHPKERSRRAASLNPSQAKVTAAVVPAAQVHTRCHLHLAAKNTKAAPGIKSGIKTRHERKTKNGISHVTQNFPPQQRLMPRQQSRSHQNTSLSTRVNTKVSTRVSTNWNTRWSTRLSVRLNIRQLSTRLNTKVTTRLNTRLNIRLNTKPNTSSKTKLSTRLNTRHLNRKFLNQNKWRQKFPSLNYLKARAHLKWIQGEQRSHPRSIGIR